MTPGGHPSDEEREARAAPVLERLVGALAASDAAGAAGVLRDDACWLSSRGRHEGEDAAARARAFAARARAWADPQQKGAHAVLRWTATDGGGDAGALVVETRGAHVVLVCEVP